MVRGGGAAMVRGRGGDGSGWGGDGRGGAAVVKIERRAEFGSQKQRGEIIFCMEFPNKIVCGANV